MAVPSAARYAMSQTAIRRRAYSGQINCLVFRRVSDKTGVWIALRDETLT
jgi:hypothetical protein